MLCDLSHSARHYFQTKPPFLSLKSRKKRTANSEEIDVFLFVRETVRKMTCRRIDVDERRKVVYRGYYSIVCMYRIVGYAVD